MTPEPDSYSHGGGRLDGKVAVVTGAGRGIGRAYAHALAAEGAAVVVNDLRTVASSAAEDVVAEIAGRGGRATANHDGVDDFDGAKRLMRSAQERFGHLDIVIANAGISRPAPIAGASPQDWSSVLAVHATGTFNCIHHAAPVLAASGGGSIVTVGDITTDLHFPGLAAYRAAKAAIAVLTLYAARELASARINVNSVMPGATDTRMSHRFFESLGSDLQDFVKDATYAYAGGGPKTAPAGPAAPESVPPLGVYLCTDAARDITGRLFALYRDAVRVVTRERPVATISPESGAFSVDELARRVPEWLAATR